MAEIKPFAGWFFNFHQLDLSSVLIPPYDVIREEEKGTYLSRSPYNLAHVLLCRPEDPGYIQAASTIARWKQQQIWIQDPKPYYYAYEQSFEIAGKTLRRRALVAEVTLEPFSTGQIKPHEKIHEKYKCDRLKILQSTRTNLSQVFGMVADRENRLGDVFESVVYTQPLFSTDTPDDSMKHTVWRIPASEQTRAFEEWQSQQPIYIVDGHHRYASALCHAQESLGTGDKKKRMLFCIVNAWDNALVVFPTHRRIISPSFTLESLQEDFFIEPFNPEKLSAFTSDTDAHPKFVLKNKEGFWLFVPRAANASDALHRTSVYWSDEVLFKKHLGIEESERSKRITYERTEARFLKESLADSVSVFLPTPTVKQVMDVADARLFFPQKTTFFSPKLFAGTIFRESD